MALVAWLAVAVLYVASSWGVRWRAEWDSALYLLTARSLAAGEGYVYAGEPFFLRPPGLSWLLAPFVPPAPMLELRAVHVLLAAAAAASVAALYALVRGLPARNGAPDRGAAGWALAVALLTATSPLVVERLHWVQSEFPFLALLFAGLALVHRSWRGGRRAALWAAAGALFLGGAVWMRSVALLVVPGLVLVPFVRALRAPGGGSRLRGVGAAALVLLAASPWLLHARSAAAEVAARRDGPSDQLLLHDYGTALLHRDPGDPRSPRVGLGGWLERAGDHGPALASDLAGAVLHTGAPAAAAALVGLVLVGFGAACRRGPTLLEWFAATYALLLVLYFDHHPRLALPLVPCAYLYAALGTRAVLARFARSAGTRRLVLGTLAAAALLANGVSLPSHLRLEERPAEEVAAEAQAAPTWGELWASERALGRWLREETAPDAVVLCQRAPILAVLSGRECYTFRFPRGRDLVGEYDPDVVLFDAPPPALVRDRALRRAEGQALVDAGRWPVPALLLGAP